ncbi:hypothetical protein BLS_003023 [Venturia inaequalis]|uniref:Uncharacterized protein n=1 Tax=Venturia inaequalis TaxID=5025 RepID=A0A8H3V8R7_VENIN|nr:hypothetical protein BLS_003023 [Venturia inaequalis]
MDTLTTISTLQISGPTTLTSNTTTTSKPSYDPSTFKQHLHTLPLELRQQILTLFLSTAISTAAEKDTVFNTSLRNIYRQTATRRLECPFHDAFQYHRQLPCLHMRDIRCAGCGHVHYRSGELDIYMPNVSVWAEFCKERYEAFVEAGGVVAKMVQQAVRRVYEGRSGELGNEWGWEGHLRVQQLAKKAVWRNYVGKAKARAEANKKTWAQVVAGK